MIDEKIVDEISFKILRRGISKNMSPKLKSVVNEYFKGTSLIDAKKKILNNKHSRLINVVYGRLNSYAVKECANKISPILGEHPSRLNEEKSFLENLLKYSFMDVKLGDSLLNVLDGLDKDEKTLLKKRYGNQEKAYIYNLLDKSKISQNYKLGLFILENILYKK